MRLVSLVGIHAPFCYNEKAAATGDQRGIGIC